MPERSQVDFRDRRAAVHELIPGLVDSSGNAPGEPVARGVSSHPDYLPLLLSAVKSKTRKQLTFREDSINLPGSFWPAGGVRKN
jgi:hypothetical protein